MTTPRGSRDLLLPAPPTCRTAWLRATCQRRWFRAQLLVPPRACAKVVRQLILIPIETKVTLFSYSAIPRNVQLASFANRNDTPWRRLSYGNPGCGLRRLRPITATHSTPGVQSLTDGYASSRLYEINGAPAG